MPAPKKPETPEEIKTLYNSWRQKKNSRYFSLCQERKSLLEKGKDVAEIDKKISDIETEISQANARLDRDLLRLYQRLEAAGNSRGAKDARRERIHRLCELGGLVEKAGIGDWTPATLLGMLLAQKDYLKQNPHMQSRWEDAGKKVFDAGDASS